MPQRFGFSEKRSPTTHPPNQFFGDLHPQKKNAKQQSTNPNHHLTTIAHFHRNQLLAVLFDALEKDGFPIGTGTHLQVQQLLASLPDNTPTDDLKTLLAPLLCGSPDRQERFYELFDQSKRQTARMTDALQALRGKPLEAKPSLWWHKYLPMSATALAILIGGVLLFNKYCKPPPPPPPEILEQVYSVVQVAMGDPVKDYCLPDSLFQSKVVGMRNACPEKAGLYVQIQMDTAANCLFYNPLSVGLDTVCLELTFEQGQADTTFVVFNVFEKTVATATDTLPALFEKNLVMRDPKLLALPAPPFWQEQLVRYQWWFKSLAVLLLAYGLWMLVKWRQRKRQQYILDYQPNTKPPYVWNIALGQEPDIGLNEGFFKLLNLLRQRTTAEAWRLSVPRTVRATVKKGGRPSFVFDQQTQPPEYLVLIDQQNSRNHRARLFDFIYKKIKANDIFIERYFFDGDLRLCWNEQHPEGSFLKDLLHRYSNARLLVGGTGYRLLSPRNGRLAEWTNLLSGWRQRALVTPVPAADWGRKERTLGQLFHVVPSGTAGLFQAVVGFESQEAPTDPSIPLAGPQTLYLEGDLMERLYFYFSAKDESGQVKSDLFVQWIAACAVYPELHWELTLQLGRLLSTEEKNLCNILPIARLCLLPWFVEGRMPDEVRQTLVHWLETNHPATMMRVRSYLFELLEKNPPPTDSAAYDQYRMNLCLNEWMIANGKKRKKQLEDEVARRLEQGHEADFVSLKKLEGERGLLDQIVPESWKKALRPKNTGKGQWADLLWALPIWFFASLGLMVLPLELPKCEGTVVEVDEGKWCVDTPEKELWVKEYHAYHFLRKRRYQAVDSVLATLHPLVDKHQLDTLPLYKNLAAISYNSGVRYFYQKAETQASIDLSNSFSDTLVENPDFRQRVKSFIGRKLAEGIHQTDSAEFASLMEENGPAFQRYFVEILADSTCAMFRRARAYEAGLPNNLWDADIREASQKYCPQENGPPDVVPTAISGQVADAATLQPLANTTVQHLPNGEKTKPGTDGRFHIALPVGDQGKPVTLAFAKEGYLPDTLTWLPTEYALPLTIGLTKKPQQPESGFSMVFSIVDAATKKQVPFAQVEMNWSSGGRQAAKFQADAFGRVRLEGTDELLRLRLNTTVEKEGYKPYRTTLQNLVTAHKKGQVVLSLEPLPLPALASSTSVLYFDDDNVTLRPDARSALDSLREMLRQNPDWQLEINAHTDGGSSVEYSRTVTDRMAAAVVNYLTGQGIAQSSLLAVSSGNAQPAAPNDTPANRAKNRRAELRLIRSQQQTTNNLDRLLKEMAADMVYVEGGRFLMGCDPKRDGDCNVLEKRKPNQGLDLHEVSLSGFYLGKYEVTQELWQAVMGSNPSRFSGCPKCPVETVNWDDAYIFIKKLNALTGLQYRLPTEAEWEYAARGANRSQDYKYPGSNDKDRVAWHPGNANQKTHPVGQKAANELGFHDMGGNVGEWCDDWYDPGYYSSFRKGAANDPKGPYTGTFRIVRGGGWMVEGQEPLTVERHWTRPDIKVADVGLRLARSR